MGMDQNDMVVVPWTTMRNRLARSGGTASTASGSASHARGDRYAASSVALYPSRDATQTANYLMPIRFDNVDSIQCKAVSADKVDDAMEEIARCCARGTASATAPRTTSSSATCPRC